MHAKLVFAVSTAHNLNVSFYAVCNDGANPALTYTQNIWHYLKQAIVKWNDFTDYCLINQVFLSRLLLILWEEPNMKSTGGCCLSQSFY